MPRSNRSPFTAALALPALLLLAGSGAFDSKAHAQTAMGEPVTVRFEIVNGTTGAPGLVERLTLDYIATRPNLVLDIEPAGSSITAQEVPIKDMGSYVVTAWKDGVPYYFSRKGRELAAEVQTLHVFDTVSDRSAVRISGLTLVLRREESLLHVEMMLQVQNDTRPQATVVGTPGSIGLHLPAELQDLTAAYHRALDPTPVPVARAGDRWELAVPLVSGGNRVRVAGVLPWREGMDLTVGSDRPVDAWSLLVAPEWTAVTSYELEPDPDSSNPGYKRFKGPVLEAGRVLALRLGSGEGGPAPQGEVFSATAADTAPPAPPPADDGSRWLPLAVPFAVLLGILLLVARRRRT